MSLQVLFIGGSCRSGSTLVERILGELPGACILGEAALLWQRALRDDVSCGCGTPLSNCEFWTSVGEKAFGGWRNVDTRRVRELHAAVGRDRLVPWPPGSRLSADRRAMIAEYADYYARIYSAAGSVTGARVVIDSSKNPGLASCLHLALAPEVRIVHLVRDPRGVAYSSTKHVPQPGIGGRPPLPRQPPAVTAIRWNSENAAFDLLARSGRAGLDRASDQMSRGVQMRRVRYEDFLADPRRTVRALAAFAGLDLTEADLSFLNEAGYVNLGLAHTAAGNPMRFAAGRIPLRLDDAWRTTLAPRHRRLVSALCAPLLMAYGYPLVTRASALNSPAAGSH